MNISENAGAGARGQGDLRNATGSGVDAGGLDGLKNGAGSGLGGGFDN